MNREDVLKILSDTGAYQTGHYKLSSGLHSGTYVQCSQLLMYPHLAAKIAEGIAELWQDEAIDMVVGPAIGGILAAYEVGRALHVPAIFAERQNGEMTLRRGFDGHMRPGLRCLVVEDVLTTGGSAQEVVEVLQSHGAEVVAATSIIDRTYGNEVKLTVPYRSLLALQVETFEPADCPLCATGQPITKPGSRPEQNA